MEGSAKQGQWKGVSHSRLKEQPTEIPRGLTTWHIQEKPGPQLAGLDSTAGLGNWLLL
jgi:hypothetical protein